MHVIFAQEKGFAINGPDFEHMHAMNVHR